MMNRVTLLTEDLRFPPAPGCFAPGVLHPRLARRLASCPEVTETYPFQANAYYLGLADPHDDRDPILAQCLPSPLEVTLAALEDPLDEESNSPVAHVIRRYPDRAVVLATTDCFVRCRHCDRKRLWRRPAQVLDEDALEVTADWIRSEPRIRDVIISGGDPLTLGNDRLEAIIETLGSIPNVETLRLGTRAPVVQPDRIDEKLLGLLRRHAPVWVNTQFNHPREVTPQAAAACMSLLRAGCPVGNQSVLLKGVNDDLETMRTLCRELMRIGVRPYYLFICEPVRGASHFMTSLSAGLDIIEGLWGHTSGLAVPTLVVDLPHGGGKVRLQPGCRPAIEAGCFLLRDYRGRIHRYPDSGGGE